MEEFEEGILIETGEFRVDMAGYEKLMTREQKLARQRAQEQLLAWQKFYKEIFNINMDISNIPIPEYRIGLNRLIVVAEGLTPEKIYQAMKKMVPAWKYLNNLDTVESVRKTDKTYAVWVRDRQEADEEPENKSANDLKSDGTNCITLEEHLLFTMMYFWEYSTRGSLISVLISAVIRKHLDVQFYTLCAGSRAAYGYAPSVGWIGDEVRVFCSCPDHARGDLRFRTVVSE